MYMFRFGNWVSNKSPIFYWRCKCQKTRDFFQVSKSLKHMRMGIVQTEIPLWIRFWMKISFFTDEVNVRKHETFFHVPKSLKHV